MYGWQIEVLHARNNKRNTSIRESASQAYQEMLDDYYSVSNDNYKVSKSQFKKDIGQFQPSFYQKQVDSVLYFDSFFHKLYIDLPLPSIERYPEQEVIHLAKNYIHQREPHDYPYIKKIVKRKSNIQFRYMAPITSFLGKSYFFTPQEYYVLINSRNGIQDSVTLLHECSHIENYLKYGMNLSKTYAELLSITREHYSFDMLQSMEDKKEVEKVRNLSLNHYISHISKFSEAFNLLQKLKRNPDFLNHFLNHFEDISLMVDVNYLHSLMSGNLEMELGYALSLIASLDIYLNCPVDRANLFITSYQIEMRKVTEKVVDRVVPYLVDTFRAYQKIKK